MATQPTRALLLSSLLAMSPQLSAAGGTDTGVVRQLSHEVVGTVLQMDNASGDRMTSNPDNCQQSGGFIVPIEHPNYSVLASSLLTAQTLQQPLSLQVDGCVMGLPAVAFVRFGNWNGVDFGTPSTYDQVLGQNNRSGSYFKFVLRRRPTDQDACDAGDIIFSEVDGIGEEYVCVGQEAGQFLWVRNRAGAGGSVAPNSPGFMNKLLHLTFNDDDVNGTTLSDVSANGYTHTAIGSSPISGEIDSGINLYSASSRLELDSRLTASLATDKDHTIATWVRPHQESANAHWSLIYSSPSNGPFTRVALYAGTGNAAYQLNTVGVGNWPAGEGYYFAAGKTISVNQWYHVILSWQASSNQLKVFVDGEHVGTQVIDKLNGSSFSSGVIGAWYLSGFQNSGGAYDEFKVYDGYIDDANNDAASKIMTNQY